MTKARCLVSNFNMKTSDRKKGLEAMLLITFTGGIMFGTTTGTEVGFDNIAGRERKYLDDVMPNDFPHEWKDQVAVQLSNTPKCKVPRF